MASLLKIRNLITPLTNRNHNLMYNVVRGRKMLTNFDYMPGPRPTNEEEMKRAAHKYGLHPAEYKLYPDDGMHPHGDYPMLPFQSRGVRDYHEAWEYPDENLHYNETLHVDFNILGEERTGVGEFEPVAQWKQTLTIFGTVFGFALLIYYTDDKLPHFMPALAQQRPAPGVVHYTFEPANK